MSRLGLFLAGLAILGNSVVLIDVFAQTAPTQAETARYSGLHLAAHSGDVKLLKTLLAQGKSVEVRDSADRTPLHVAALASRDEIVEMLARAGADMNALEHQAYDIVTIAAVANDLPLMDIALRHGASAANITSPYDGTALIAASHLGYHDIVARLIEAGAPLDHINNIGWTALLEAVILGDGGAAHVQTVKHLLNAGADKNITDRQGFTPLQLVQISGYDEMVKLLDQ